MVITKNTAKRPLRQLGTLRQPELGGAQDFFTVMLPRSVVIMIGGPLVDSLLSNADRPAGLATIPSPYWLSTSPWEVLAWS